MGNLFFPYHLVNLNFVLVPYLCAWAQRPFNTIVALLSLLLWYTSAAFTSVDSAAEIFQPNIARSP